MVCKNCGEPFPKEAVFCPNCGVRVDGNYPADEIPPAEETKKAEVSTQNNLENTGMGLEKKQKKGLLRKKSFWIAVCALGVAVALFLHADYVKQQKLDCLKSALSVHHEIITSGQTLAECWNKMCENWDNADYYWNECRAKISSPAEIRQGFQGFYIFSNSSAFDEETAQSIKDVKTLLGDEVSAYEKFYAAVGDFDKNRVEKILTVKYCCADLLAKSDATIKKIGEAAEKITGKTIAMDFANEETSALEYEAVRDVGELDDSSDNIDPSEGVSLGEEGSDTLLNYYGKDINDLMRTDSGIVAAKEQYEYGFYHTHKGSELFIDSSYVSNEVLYVESRSSKYSLLGLRVGDSEEKMLSVLGKCNYEETDGGYWFDTAKEYEFHDVTEEIDSLYIGIDSSGEIEFIAIGAIDA